MGKVKWHWGKQIGHKYNLTREQRAALAVTRFIRFVNTVGYKAYLPIMTQSEWVAVVEVEE